MLQLVEDAARQLPLSTTTTPIWRDVEAESGRVACRHLSAQRRVGYDALPPADADTGHRLRRLAADIVRRMILQSIRLQRDAAWTRR